MDEEARLRRRVRIWLWVFIVGFVVSGMTAFPLVHEVGWLVREGLEATARRYPILAHGTDWLACAHLVIAAAFVRLLLLDPVRNKWLFAFGLIGCAGAVALIAGAVRAIPIDWRMIDRSFGVFGCQPLLLRLSYMSWLEQMEARAIRVAV